NGPVIRIKIDPASFKELSVYNNVRFQLDGSANFHPADTSELWTRMELKKGRVWGLYTITFSNPKKTVSYKVRPVLDGTDYDQALVAFGKQNDEYNRKLEEWLRAEKARREEAARQTTVDENKTFKEYYDSVMAVALIRSLAYNHEEFWFGDLP